MYTGSVKLALVEVVEHFIASVLSLYGDVEDIEEF